MTDSRDCANDQELVITTIRATDVAVGLRCVPASFYTAVRHSDREWRTANKPVYVNNDAVQWGGPIPIPSDMSVKVHFGVYASFEFRPILGQGEVLQEFSVTTKQLVDHSDKGFSFTFRSLLDNTAPCLSLLVTVQRRERSSSTPKSLAPYRSIARQPSLLEEATNQGHSAFSRYQKNREIPDLEHSIDAFERALKNCSSNHPCRAAAQSNLAMAKFAHCQVDGSGPSFDVAITLYHDALASRPTGHPDRPSTLIKLAAMHFFRFERQQDSVDATQAETLLREAIGLSAVDSHEKHLALQRLAECAIGSVQAGEPLSTERASTSGLTDEGTSSPEVLLLRRFEHCGDLAALREAISVLEASTSDSVRDHNSLDNLGVALWYRFTRFGRLNDLDQAIKKQTDAVDSIPDGHPDKPGRLNNLGNSLLTRFHHLGNVVDLKRAISRHRSAINLAPDDHRDKPRHMSNLGNCFLASFECLGKLPDLEQAIAMHKDADRRISDGHPDKPNHLNNLATCLRARFRYLNERIDLDQAISHHLRAVELAPDGHHNRSAYLNNFATSLLTRFIHGGESSDLEEAISKHEEVLQLTPDGHMDKPRRLNIFANSCVARAKCFGELNTLEKAISVHQEAIKLTSDGHPDKPRRVNNLANSFRALYEYHDGSSSLEQAILGHQKAMNLAAKNGDSHVYSDSLATSFLTRFKRLGSADDLEAAISRYNDAAELTRDDHRRKPGYLNNLGMSLVTRFEWFGDLGDLKQGISRLREAVALTTASPLDEKADYLHNLGVCLRIRFTHLGQPGDLEEAISSHQNAVKSVSGGYMDHPNGWKHRTNVSTTLIRIGHWSDGQGDLEQVISSYEEAIRLTSERHPDKWHHLDDLANCLLARFEQLGELDDLDKAAELHKEATHLRASLSGTCCGGDSSNS